MYTKVLSAYPLLRGVSSFGVSFIGFTVCGGGGERKKTYSLAKASR